MKNKHRYVYAILTTVIVALCVFSIYKYYDCKSLENTVENNYNRAFHELVNYVDDIDTLLQKSMLVSSATQLSTISSELFRQTTAAKACLGQLPISEIQLENTEKFLSQIGDFTYLLSQNVINDNEISDEEYQTLSELSTYASNLNSGLLKMQEDVYSGNISFGTINRKSQEYFNNSALAAANDVLSSFETVEKEFQEYPSLIYDGPFSEHIQNMESALLGDKAEISSDDGLVAAKKLLGDRGQNLAYSGESQNTAINSYSYSATFDNRDVYVSITKNGGYPVYFLDTREVSEENLSIDEAITAAKDFLYQNSFTSLTESYFDKNSNIATINFAYTQSDIICYSDLIKVKVALDNGEIVGMEANGYLMNHKQRSFPQIKISEAEAKALVNPNLSVDESSLALIPKDSKREVLCYEFKGNHNGRNFLVYINVENAYEEQILMLIESEDGVLTI